MTTFSWHDVIAGLLAVGLLVAIVLLAVLGVPVPDVIVGAFGASIAWAFRGAAANGALHRTQPPGS